MVAHIKSKTNRSVQVCRSTLLSERIRQLTLRFLSNGVLHERLFGFIEKIGHRGHRARQSLMPGMILCLLISVTRNYKSVTWTQCGAVNWFPSASACIGNHSLQRCIWIASVSLYIGQRILSIPMLYRLFRVVLRQDDMFAQRILNPSRAVVYTLEQICMFLLTYFSSTDNLFVHTVAFAGVCTFNSVNMLITCELCRRWLANVKTSPVDSTLAWGGYLGVEVAQESLTWRNTWAVVSFLALTCAIGFYYTHERWCPHGAYSYFAISEWVFIFSTFAFHHAECREFRNVELSVLTRKTTPHCHSTQ